jgi:hypothetical protein
MVVKTGQLADRSIYVYLPTVEMADEWKSLADRAKISISKFVIEHVDNSLSQEKDRKSNYASRTVLLKQLKEKDEEIAKLKKDNRLLKMLADNLDKELKKHRARPFSDEGRVRFEGVREYDRELVELLRKSGIIDSDSILQELGISPKDTELVKSINRQLRNLQAYGLTEPTPRGWKWLG